jgi:glucose-1-phosphate cytidylyltransferase
MKAVIFAGGHGTRISEESGVRPKPMVEIGGRPVLWHIMNIYAAHGVKEFVILAGYKSHMIKDYFANYWMHSGSATFDLKNNTTTIESHDNEDWIVTVVETGVDTLTAGRLQAARKYIGDEPFFLTYGDGVSDFNIQESLDFHKKQNVLVTATVVQPPGRFGMMQLKDNESIIEGFREKPTGDGGGWINAGFFVVEPAALDYIKEDTMWEQEPLVNLAHDRKLAAYRHAGFWHPMDTLRDKHVLEKMWTSGNAPWKK